MSMLYINARCKKLLNIMLAQSDYLTMNQLAQALSVSKRTAYYDVYKVNEWLEDAGLSQLEIVREKGLFLTHKERGRVQELLETDTERQVYIYSPEERVKLIICYLTDSREAVYIEQLMECCEVSRNTIFGDLKEVGKRLEQYSLTLEYQSRTGYFVEGDTIRLRALFILYFNEMRSLFLSGTVKFFHREQLEDHLERLEQIQRELGVDYVEGALLSLAALVPLMYQHKKELQFTGLKEDGIARTREFALVQQFFPDLEWTEQLYLSLHLLGSRVNLVPDEFFECASNQWIYDLTKALISEFEKVTCIVFDNREQLERALFVHLNTSIYRYKFGIQIGNLLGDDVMHEYPDLFALTKIAVNRLEKRLGFPIPDSEVAYLVLHFGGFLKIASPDNNRLRILIVCVNGISTGNMLKREVHKLLPFAEIVNVIAAVDMVNIQNICDLVISTVKLNSIVPVITVHPILTEFDRRMILNHKLVAPRSVEIQRDRLFQSIKKYVHPKDYENLLNDLTAYIQNGGQELALEQKNEHDLLSILDATRITICAHARTWQESIRIAGQCLLDYRSIESKYLGTIISQLQYYGPYMFLTEDVILAHARPEDGVNCLDISFAAFQTPVVFSELRKAKLVIILAAEDQEKHLRILQDILELIGDPDSIEQLAACETPSTFLALVGRILAEQDET